MYRPLFTRASNGFSASSGIAQYEPIFIAPGILPALQRSFIHLAERFHFSEVCLIDKYPIPFSILIREDVINRQNNCTPNLAEKQSVFHFLLPKYLGTSLICKQCFLGQTLRKQRSPVPGQLACWDIPKPLSIITS